jgi:aspartate aminotransferase
MEKEGFQYLPEMIEEKLNSRVKGIVINSPSNPTGNVMGSERMKKIANLGIPIISDEIYHGLVYQGEAHSILEFTDQAFVINGFSKLYAMTGWRLGYLAAPEKIVAQCLKVHQYCQACATSISQYAALAAYSGDQSPVKMMRDEYRVRRDLICKGLEELGFVFPVPEGAFYTFVPMKPVLTQKIINNGIIIVPGSAFGVNAPEYARFSYATSRENLYRALERIQKIMRN